MKEMIPHHESASIWLNASGFTFAQSFSFDDFEQKLWFPGGGGGGIATL
jgi:hypothetical protein